MFSGSITVPPAGHGGEAAPRRPGSQRRTAKTISPARMPVGTPTNPTRPSVPSSVTSPTWFPFSVKLSSASGSATARSRMTRREPSPAMTSPTTRPAARTASERPENGTTRLRTGRCYGTRGPAVM